MPRGKSGGEMDASETSQRLEWLEQERQRDKALLTELQKRAEQQEVQLTHTEEVTEALSEMLSGGSVELRSLSRFEKALQQFKEEIMLELRKAEERLARDSQGMESRLRAERREWQSTLARLEQRVEEALGLQKTLSTHQAHIDRLTKTASTIGMQIEGMEKEGRERRARSLAVEDRMRRSEERTTDLFQVQEAASSRAEDIVESLRLAQTQAERLSQQLSDLESSGEELRQEHAALANELRAVDDRVKKRTTGWTKEMGKWRADAEALRERVALSDKLLRNGDRMLASLDEMRIQLESDREAIQHVERTAEERQRQQLEDWRQENALLWLRNNERWEQLSEENTKRDGITKGLWEAQFSHLRREVNEMEKLMKQQEKRLARLKR
jgi:chromosome segregation ATPase